MSDKLTFKPIHDGASYAVEKCDRGAVGKIAIPAIHNGKPVTGINAMAFMFCSKLTDVEIPQGVTHIGRAAFQGCSGLKEIVIPESVTKIEDFAFEGCKGLVIEAKGYTEWPLGDWSVGFTGTGNNIKINWKKKELVPAGELSLCLIDRTETYEVKSCESGAASVVVPSAHNGKPIVRIGRPGFSGCKNLTDVSIPDSVGEVKEGAFKDTAIWEKAANKNIVYADNWALGYKGKKGDMKGALSLRPGTVGIARYAFSGQPLSDITIPASLKYIGDGAFYDCKKIQSIVVEDGNTAFESDGYFLRRAADKKVLCKSVINIYKPQKIDGEALVFDNFNFKLAIIEVLMYEKELLQPKFDARDFAASYQKREIDIDEEGYEPIKEIKKYFQDLQIDKKFAGEVEALNIDAGNEIYGQIMPFWDGEDDYYDVKKLSEKELAQFPNLKKITGTVDFFQKVSKTIEAAGIAKEI